MLQWPQNRSESSISLMGSLSLSVSAIFPIGCGSTWIGAQRSISRFRLSVRKKCGRRSQRVKTERRGGIPSFLFCRPISGQVWAVKPPSAAVNAGMRGKRRETSKTHRSKKSSSVEENPMINRIQFRHFIKIQSFCRAKYEDFSSKIRRFHSQKLSTSFIMDTRGGKRP